MKTPSVEIKIDELVVGDAGDEARIADAVRAALASHLDHGEAEAVGYEVGDAVRRQA